jgi:hypothetical protein
MVIPHEARNAIADFYTVLVERMRHLIGARPRLT